MIPNDWVDATPANEWRLDEERERASIEFTTAHGKIWWNGSLKSEKAIEFCRNQLKKCGWNGDMNSRALSTATVRIKVEEETYEGKARQAIKAISNGAPKPPKDPVKARSLAAKLAGAAATSSDPFGNAPTFNDASDPGDGADDISFP